MKRKYRILPEYRENLIKQLSELRITRNDIASEAGVSYRAVSYFFEGSSDSQKVLKACIKVLKERSTQELRTALAMHERTLELI